MEYFNILPVEISLHIFSLLPIESASDFALVSKTWKNLIHSPSFYKMHSLRLLRLAREAEAEFSQKLKELKDCCESVRQFTQTCQSVELLQQIYENHRENREEKTNSMRLSQQKLAHYTRLAGKCVLIFAKCRGAKRTKSIRLAKKSIKMSAKFSAMAARDFKPTKTLSGHESKISSLDIL
ncbi:uncharacterized protein LOC113280872 [Papaver somniferum]|uniref:uncharacterized protein LOC113280872 n=1 Tax=Papaver somniferum TaxID=3469 RepID=UPI000E702496|nr:uncharacterized protein LOC113280872 [Papaver somniferum]XP_026385237.1 uncharacterized protein LOC113280872 [Papaver somniferum]XP_026385238.1 uncharacterized protein LOC113280872 [Papaver somniferum]XP_026385239.1 uncharacterized protein LOC113280872 [Papaver somniferum]